VTVQPPLERFSGAYVWDGGRAWRYGTAGVLVESRAGIWSLSLVDPAGVVFEADGRGPAVHAATWVARRGAASFVVAASAPATTRPAAATTRPVAGPAHSANERLRAVGTVKPLQSAQINLAGVSQGLRVDGLSGAAAAVDIVKQLQNLQGIQVQCPAGTRVAPVRVRLVAAQAGYDAIASQWAQVQYYAAGEYALVPGQGPARFARAGNSPSGASHHDRFVLLGAESGRPFGLPAETTAVAVFVDSDLATTPSLYAIGDPFSTTEPTWRALFIGTVGLRATAEYACVPADPAAYVATAAPTTLRPAALTPAPTCTVTRVTIAGVLFAEGTYGAVGPLTLGHSANSGSAMDRWVLLGNVGWKFGLRDTLAVVAMGTGGTLTPLIYSPYTGGALSSSSKWLYSSDASPVRGTVTVEQSCR
jgi:hypothetical protein